jgi:predicted ATPase/DNA-binding winged helix-turn-helix (wHTH) protein
MICKACFAKSGYRVHPAVPSVDDAIAFGPFHLFPAQHMLLEAGEPVRLGSRALEILVALVERPGEMVSKRELVARVWPDTVVEEGNLKAHIAALRKALGDGRDGNRYLVNVPGRGYSFVAPVVRPKPPAPPSATFEGHPPSSHAPVPLTRILGREDVVETISDRMAVSRLVTVVGPGGIGKTTVALAIAAQFVASKSDSIGFVDLAPLADPLLVPSALATMLGVGVRSDNPVPSLIAFLAGRQMLIVLDSCEHVVTAVATLASALLEGVADLHILATSREPLRVPGENVQRLPPLKTPATSDSLTAAEALTFPSIQLFVERTSERIGAFRLTDIDAPLVGEICRKLDGNPLAIELAAGRVDAFGIRGVVTLLNDRLRLLTSGWRNAPPRHQTLMVTLDWSYELLAESERVLLRRLGIFVGYFDLDAASKVAASGAVTSSDVLNGVATLVDKSLVSADLGRTAARYRLLDTTAAYARKQLIDHAEFNQSARSHAEYYLALLERAGAEANLQRNEDWAIAYGAHVDNVRAALEWAFSLNGNAVIGVSLTIAAVPLWLHLSLMNECRNRVNRALESVKCGVNGDRRQEMQLLTALGVALYSIGPGSESETVWTKVLKISEEVGDIDYQLRALWGLWVVCVTGGNHRSGLSLAKQYATLAAKTTDRVALFVGDRLVGTSLHFLGEHQGARRHFYLMLGRQISSTTRMQIVRFQFDQSVAGRAFFSRILWVQGYPDQAAHEAEGSVEDAQTSRHGLSLCYALGQAACPMALLTGDMTAAQRNVSMLLEHSVRHELPLWQTMGRCFSGMLQFRRGDHSSGLLLLGQAIDELREAGFVLYHTAALCEYAGALGSVGELARAQAAINEALAQSARNDELWCIPELLRVKGELVLLEAGANTVSAAKNYFHKSFALAQQQGALSWELRAATSLARLETKQCLEGQANKLLARAYARFSEGFDTADMREARSLLVR